MKEKNKNVNNKVLELLGKLGHREFIIQLIMVELKCDHEEASYKYEEYMRNDYVTLLSEEIIEFKKPVQKREFYVTFLAEVYYDDGGESLTQMHRTCLIDILDPDEKEDFEELSCKLERRLNETLPENMCVNYVQDAEYRGVRNV